MTNFSVKQVTYKIPDGFEVVNPMAVHHPDNPIVYGALCRNISTGVYVIVSAGIVNSCPQKWAVENATK